MTKSTCLPENRSVFLWTNYGGGYQWEFQFFCALVWSIRMFFRVFSWPFSNTPKHNPKTMSNKPEGIFLTLFQIDHWFLTVYVCAKQYKVLFALNVRIMKCFFGATFFCKRRIYLVTIFKKWQLPPYPLWSPLTWFFHIKFKIFNTLSVPIHRPPYKDFEEKLNPIETITSFC